MGVILTTLAKNDLTSITKEIQKFDEDLQRDHTTIEEIKNLLEVIAKIRKTSMDMELRIGEAQEQFRVLKMYKYKVEEED